VCVCGGGGGGGERGGGGLSFGWISFLYNLRIGHRDNNVAKASGFSIKKKKNIYRLANSGVTIRHPARLTTMYI